MSEIIPAIMPKDFADLKEKISQVAGAVPLVQIDIMDGRLTPEKSWPYKNDQGTFGRITSEEEGFPLWEEVEFEADLMVKDPEEVVHDWIIAGAKRIVGHIEATKDFSKFISSFKEIGVSKDSPVYVEIGIALDTTTPNEMIYPFISQVDFIQCMGIAKIGFQGQPFDERVLPKIADFRKKYPDIAISVDGGVNLDTAPRLLQAGATRLVVGSAIYSQTNVISAINTFRKLAGDVIK